jgi:molecular chaperone IbpA
MSAFDFGPLFRSGVGFDQLERLFESASQWDQSSNSYPPYNIETWEHDGENHYRITMAVAGFGEDELGIETHEDAMTVVGKKKTEQEGVHYLHRGIAGRDFIRKFHLADHVIVKGANLDNGVLSIDLVREVPEEKKPRTIAIKKEAPAGIVSKAKKLLEGEQAA